MNYYFLDFPRDPWGDYGSVLQHGLCTQDKKAGVVRLRRTGPYVPPISNPVFSLVVTEALRRDLEASGLSGLRFVKVVKEKIVELDWQSWNRKAEWPHVMPESGEPEDYIDERPHTKALAAQIGDLWSIQLSLVAKVGRDRRVVSSRKELWAVGQTLGDLDFVGSRDVGLAMVSQRAKDWLTPRVGKLVVFEELTVR